MKMKSNKISIANLNPAFTKPLQAFDLMHRKYTGSQAIVTSVDTGKHWGSIKKEDRPYGWQAFTVAEVKKHSDSKHYNIPCDALDFRRRNPDPENSGLYYDELSQSEKTYFMLEMDTCFPDHIFDVVFSRMCIHVERDPNKPRKLTDEDLEIKAESAPGTPVPDLELIEPIELPKMDTKADNWREWFVGLFLLPPWKRSGFKRISGTIISTVGGILILLPKYSGIGQAILAAGSFLGIGGMAHGAIKNKKSDDKTQIIKMVLLWLADFVMKLIKKRRV